MTKVRSKLLAKSAKSFKANIIMAIVRSNQYTLFSRFYMEIAMTEPLYDIV